MKRMMRHNINPNRTFGTGVCDCGKRFDKYAPNQIHCDDCSFWVNATHGRYYGRAGMNAGALKAAADRSGNPRVWTAEMHDQAFLRSLIPTR